MGFDRSKFLAANNAIREDSGDFFTPDPGFYICTLASAATGNAKTSGRFQVVFQWNIAPDDEKYPNKMFYDCIGLDNEEGYKQLSRKLNRLGYKGDPESFAVDPDGELATLVNTQVRMQIQNAKNPEFRYYNIQKILSSPITDDAGKVNVQTEDTDLITETPPSNDDTIEPGDELHCKFKDGEGLAIVQLVNEASQQVVVTRTSTGATLVVNLPDVLRMSRKAREVIANPSGIPPQLQTPAPATKELPKPMAATPTEEVIEEIQEEIKLEKGMMVEGIYNGQKIIGKVHIIDQPNAVVKIAMNGKAYPCKLDTIKVVS